MQPWQYFREDLVNFSKLPIERVGYEDEIITDFTKVPLDGESFSELDISNQMEADEIH